MKTRSAMNNNSVKRAAPPSPPSSNKRKSKSTVIAPTPPISTVPGARAYFLIKSEPESRIQNGHEMAFSIDDLSREPDETAHWDGVRNFEARNRMQQMKCGDLAFFYHSNTKRCRPGIVGVVEVVKEAYPGMLFFHVFVYDIHTGFSLGYLTKLCTLFYRLLC